MGLRLKIILLIILLPTLAYAGPPSRTYTYTAGTTIRADHVTTNEDNLYTYVQDGVDTFEAGSVDTTALGDNSVTTGKIVDGTITNADVSLSAGIVYSKLAFSDNITTTDIATNGVGSAEIAANSVDASELVSTAVSAGSYTACDLTVDADGRLTAASSGTIDLTSEVSGVLDETNGGTGQSTITQGDILYGSASNVLSKLGAGTNGQFLKTQGAAANPTWADVDILSNIVFSYSGSIDTGTRIGQYIGSNTTPQFSESHTSTYFYGWTGDSSALTEVVFYRTKFYKLSSIDTVTVWTYAWFQAGDAPPGNNVILNIDIGSAGTTGHPTTTCSWHWKSYTVDVSGLTDDTLYDVTMSFSRSGTGGQSGHFIASIVGIGS